MKYPLPYQITLISSRKKWGLLFAGCLTFTFLCIFLLTVSDEKWGMWLGIVFFGFIGIPISLFAVLKPGTLQLNALGFEWTMLGRRSAYAWKDVSDFCVISAGSTPLIGFTARKGDAKKSDGKMSGKTLGDTYGKKPSELADLMNAFRKRGLETEAMKSKYRSIQ